MIKIITKKQLWLGWLGGLGLFLPVACNPALAAERIYISYGALERSVPIEALELYAKEGRVTRELAAYARYFNSRRLAQLRVGLRTRIDLDPVTVSQFLYSPIGEQLLQRLGRVIQTPSRQSGFYAIRAALILAAAEPDGLTALNVLCQFPTQGIRINAVQALDIFNQVQQLVNQTKDAVSAIQSQSQVQAINSEANIDLLYPLQFSGPFAWQKETLKLEDPSRVGTGLNSSIADTFPVDVYLPKVTKTGSLPVIVISYGLGSRRLAFEYLAEHLASYGFVVAVPEHPGSNAQQLRALLNGQADRVVQPREFVDRPFDIKLLLNELEQRSQSDPYYQRLNLEQVGVIGHSFGGYTALALAGADLNFKQLQQDCDASLNRSLNVSLLLQCRALALPKRNYDLSDPRVKAVVAINPVTSSVFGQSGLSSIKVPTLIVAGSADTVAPALLEQIQPFTQLATQQKYLAVIERGTHFSVIDEEALSTGILPIPPVLNGPEPSLVRRYLRALSVAFFRAYITNQNDFARYLTPGYTTKISQPPLRLSIVQQILEPVSSESEAFPHGGF